MRFFENIAKQIFNQEGIPILEGHVAYSPEEAMTIASEMGIPVVIKAQVLTGGRGKAGGVKFANNPGEALKVADEILGMEIKGEKVKHLLIEKKAEILNEFFVTVSIDRGARKPVILASMEGGVEIENLAKTNPEKIIKYYPNPLIEFLPYEAREIARRMGVPSELISQMGDMIWNLYNVFEKYDAVILPVGSGPAKLLDGSKTVLEEDDTTALEEHLQIGNFGGFPSITIPDGFVSNLPVGLNITGKCYDDANVLNIAYALESVMDYKDQIAKEVK